MARFDAQISLASVGQPGEKVGNFGPFASDEVGNRVAVPITQWSPVFGPLQSMTLGADVPDSPAAATAPGAVRQGWASPCSYQLADLAALRPGSGSAPDQRLQGQADQLEASYRDTRLHEELGQAGTRGPDMSGGPRNQPGGRPTPPG